MSLFDGLFDNYGAPTLMRNLATPAKVTLEAPDPMGDVNRPLLEDADAIVGPIRVSTDLVNGIPIDVIEREIILTTDSSTIHKGIADKVLTQAICKIAEAGTEDGEFWTVNEVTARTEQTVTLLLRDPRYKEITRSGKYEG